MQLDLIPICGKNPWDKTLQELILKLSTFNIANAPAFDFLQAY